MGANLSDHFLTIGVIPTDCQHFTKVRDIRQIVKWMDYGARR